MNYAVIGGTGLEHLDLPERKAFEQPTPYGTVSLESGLLGGQEVVFVSRHGKEHAVPPHLVNYRANVWALHELGVKKVLATAAVGSLSDKYSLGEIVLLDQFLDFTKNRPQTFFKGETRGVLHVDMTEPYCRELQEAVFKAGRELGLRLGRGVTYVCTEGPRFETPAEIRMFQQLGGGVVGMTSVPEVILAKELGMCYAALGLVTNEAAGIAQHPLTHAEVLGSMTRLGKTVAGLLERTLSDLSPERTCNCALAGAEAGNF